MIGNDLLEDLINNVSSDKVKVFKLNKDEVNKLEGKTLFDIIKYLKDKEENRNKELEDEYESEPKKSIPIEDENGKVYEEEDKMEETFKPSWGIIKTDSNVSKDYISLLVTAPFAIKESVKVSVSKDTENPKGYAVTVEWKNSKIPVVSGNLKLKEFDTITILGFKKIDKKTAKVTYQDGCFVISMKQISEKESDIFTFGM